jgi:MFS family permease
LFLAPRADRFGRRAIVMLSVAIVSLGMLASAFAASYQLLAVLRAITGIGIGGILASATVLVAEYASDRWRSTASFLYTSGYSIGGTVGGAIAALLIGRFGWRTAFEFGAAASFLMLPISYWARRCAIPRCRCCRNASRPARWRRRVPCGACTRRLCGVRRH